MMKYSLNKFDILTLEVLIPQNGQTQPNRHFVGSGLNRLTHKFEPPCLKAKYKYLAPIFSVFFADVCKSTLNATRF